MQQVKYILALIIAFLIFNNNLKGNEVTGYGIHYSNQVEKGETFEIHLANYHGDIQWQKSYDNESWNNIEGETSKILAKEAEKLTFYRAVITDDDSDCDPHITESMRISVYELFDHVVVLDTNSTELISDSSEIAVGTFQFSFNGESETEVEAGDIIVSQHEKGYIREVTYVEQAEDEIIMETTQGTLEDVFMEFDLKDSVQVVINDDSEGISGGMIIPLEVDHMIEGATLNKRDVDGLGIDLSGTVLYRDTLADSIGGVPVSIEILEGGLGYEPVLNFELSFDGLFGGVETYKFSTGGELYFDCIIEAQLYHDWVTENDQTIAGLNLGPFWIGPVPVFVKIDFIAGFELETNLHGTVQSGFSSSFGMEFGARYNKNKSPAWTPILNQNGNFEREPVTWSAEAGVFTRVYIEPRITASIASIAGPYKSVQPHIGFEGESEVLYDDETFNCWDWELFAGLDGIIGFEVSIIGREIADFPHQYPICTQQFATGMSEPYAYFNADGDTTFVQSGSVTFSENSCNASTWEWKFPGGEPSYSFERDPGTINYDEPGTYDVKLIISNQSGTDTMIKEDYIIIE